MGVNVYKLGVVHCEVCGGKVAAAALLYSLRNGKKIERKK